MKNLQQSFFSDDQLQTANFSNSHATELKLCHSTALFKRKLKTLLFTSLYD